MTRKRRLSFASVLALATAVLLLTTAVVCVADVRNAYADDAAASVSVWDGTSDTSWYNETDTEFTITTAQQLAGLAALVNSGKSFSDITIKLGADIDLNGRADGDTEWIFSNADYTASGYTESGVTLNTKHLWTPIGNDFNDAKAFSGTLDGQGHTIYRMAVVVDTKGAGFIATPYGGKGFTIKNLTFDDCVSMSRASGEDLCAIVVGYSAYYYAEYIPTMENVTVQNSMVRGDNAVGIFAGQINSTNVKNCVSKSNTVYANATSTANAVGGFFGKISDKNGYAVFENNRILQSTLVLPANKSQYGLWGGFNGECTFNSCISDSTDPVTSDDGIAYLTNNNYVIGLTDLTIDGENKIFDFVVSETGVMQYYAQSNSPVVNIEFLDTVSIESFKVNGADSANYQIDSTGKILTISGLEDKANDVLFTASLYNGASVLNFRLVTGCVAMPEVVKTVDGNAFENAANFIINKDGINYFNDVESDDSNILKIGFATELDVNAKAIVKHNGDSFTITGNESATLGKLTGAESYSIEYYYMDVPITTVNYSDIKCLKSFGIDGLYYLNENYYKIGSTNNYDWIKVSASDTSNELGYDYYMSSNAGQSSSTSSITLIAIDCAGIAWSYAMSSESSYDFLFTVVNGTRKDYKGVNSGSVLKDLTWNDEEVSFDDRSFNIIQFTYAKDGSGDDGLDRSFLKNFKVVQGFDLSNVETAKVSISDGKSNPVEQDINKGDVINLKYGVTNKVTFLIPVLNQGETCYVTDNGTKNENALIEERGYYQYTIQNAQERHELVFSYEKENFAKATFAVVLDVLYEGNIQEGLIIGGNVLVNNEEYSHSMVFNSALSNAERTAFSSSNQSISTSFSGLTLTVYETGTLKFDYYISTEGNYDVLYYSQNKKINLDNKDSCEFFPNNDKAAASGEQGWRSASIPVTVPDGGSVTLHFVYYKDGSGDKGQDTFAIANVMLATGERKVDYSCSNADAGSVSLKRSDGTVVGSGVAVSMGETLTLSATANDGYEFYAWKNVKTNTIIFDKEFSFPLMSDGEYIAIIEESGKYKFRSDSDFFEDIESAFNSVTSGNIFMICNYSIADDITIPSGVTFILTYSRTDLTGYAQGGNSDRTSWFAGINPYVTLTVNGKLTLNGKLIVGGVQHKADQSAQGHTSGAYAQMVVNGSIEIANGGYLDVIGRVSGNGTITAKAGATLRQPFMVNNYSGGTNTYALYNAGQFPFVQFATNNVECNQVVEYGAKVIGSTSLYFWSSITTQDVVLVDKIENKTAESEGALIWMHEGSSLEISYDSGKKINAKVGNIHLGDFGVTTIDVYGNITAGEFSLQGYGSGTMVLAIPYTYNFNIKSGATVNIDQAYKIMPGAIVTIENGATVNITENGKLYVYDGLYQSSKNGKRYPYYDELEGYGFAKSGMLIVNGTLNINGTFAGIAQTVEGGEINVGENANVANQTIVEGCNDGYDYNKATFDMSGRVYGVNGFVNLAQGKTYRTFANNTFALNSFTNKYFVGVKDSYGEQEFTLNPNQAMQGRFAQWNGQKFVLTLTFYIGADKEGVIVNVNGSDYQTDSNGRFTCSVEVANATDLIKYYTKNVYTAVKSQALVLDQEMQTLTYVASGVTLNNDNVYMRVCDKDGEITQNFSLFATVSFYGTTDTESVELSFDENVLNPSVYINNNVALTNSSLVKSIDATLKVVGSDVAQFINDVDNLKNANDIVATACNLFATYGTLSSKGTGDDVAFITDYLNGYIGFANNIVKEITIAGSATYGDGSIDIRATYVNGTTATEIATLSGWRIDNLRIVATATLARDYQGANYNVTNTCDGSKKAVTLNAITGDSAVYDGTMHTVTATLSGLADFDNDTHVYATASFGKNAGKHIVTFALAGDKAAFYALENGTYTCTVTAKDVTITVNAAQAIVGKTDTIVLVANVNGNVDEIAFTFAIYNGETLVATVDKDGKVALADGQTLIVGEYTVKAVTDNRNYNIASQTAGTLSVVKANDYYEVNFNLGESKVYDGKTLNINPTVTVKATGALVDSDKYTVSITGKGTQILDAGTYEITVMLDGETIAQESYIVTANDVIVTIKPQSSVYGDDVIVKNDMFEVSGVIEGDDLKISLATDNAARNAGKYDIAGEWNNSNYNVTFVGGEKAYEITAKAIVVEIENKASFYGEKDVALSAIPKCELAYNDSLDSLGIKLVREEGKNAGTYAITLDSWTNKNYTITAENANYTVKRLTLRAIVANATSVYGDALANLTFTIEGNFAEGENKDMLNAKLSIGNAKNAGTYDIEFSYDNKNYDVTATAATYTITKRAVTLLVQDATSVYGNPDATLTVLVREGTMAEDEDAQSLVSITRTTGRNAGTYEITATKVENANYDVTIAYTSPTNSEYTITKRPVTVTVRNAQLPYTATWTDLNAALEYEANGLAGDNLNVRLFVLVGGVELTEANFNSMFAGGNHAISATIDNDNYKLTVVNGELTVGLPVVSLTNEAREITRVYGNTQNIFDWRTMLTGYLASATDNSFRAKFYSATDTNLTSQVDIATADAGTYKMQIEIVHTTAYTFEDGSNKSELVDVIVEKADVTESIVITLVGLTNGRYLVFSYGLSIDASVTGHDDIEIIKVLTKDGAAADDIDAVGAYEYTATIQDANYQGAKTLQFKVVNSAKDKIEDLKKYAGVEFLTKAQYTQAKALVESITEDDTLQINDDAEAKANYENAATLCAKYAKIAENLDAIKTMLDAYAAGESKKLAEAHDYIVALDEEKLTLVKQSEEGKAYQEAWQAARVEGSEATEIANKVRDNALFGIVAAVSALLAMAYVAFGKFRG